jgi:hypothetical protein
LFGSSGIIILGFYSITAEFMEKRERQVHSSAKYGWRDLTARTRSKAVRGLVTHFDRFDLFPCVSLAVRSVFVCLFGYLEISERFDVGVCRVLLFYFTVL